MKVSGLAVPFGVWTDIGGSFMERFAPGAFTKSLRERGTFALHHHDGSLVLGRTENRSLILRETERGLEFGLDLAETSLGRDLHALIKRGDVAGVSIGFFVSDPDGERWWQGRNGRIYREITQAEVLEVSTTAMPAYPSTEIHARAEQNMPARSSSAVRAGMVRRYMHARLTSAGIAA